ncbi:MAG: DUF3775 domain-containing protein [Gammaproteobacteria bacterium]
MLNLNPDIVCAIIEKCHEFHGQEGVSIPHAGDDYDDDWAMQVLADHADDSTYQELKYLIDDLEPSHQVELVALMWMGRGDFAIDEWQDAIKQAYDSWNSRTAEYLLGSPLVADYLQEALQEMGYQCNE